MLKDLPLPSLAALADLIRLPTLAKGIMGDGAVEGGAASFGISRCVHGGHATYYYIDYTVLAKYVQ